MCANGENMQLSSKVLYHYYLLRKGNLLGSSNKENQTSATVKWYLTVIII